jgi:hypothetical protein
MNKRTWGSCLAGAFLGLWAEFSLNLVLYGAFDALRRKGASRNRPLGPQGQNFVICPNGEEEFEVSALA